MYWPGIVESLVFGVVGIFMAIVAFIVMDLVTPGHFGKQIAHDKNMALAVLAGLCFIGVSIIIAAAIVG